MNDLKPTNNSETRTDFKISWQYLKANYKSFIATELFAFFAFIIVFSLMVSIVVLIFHFSPELSLIDLLPSEEGHAVIRFRVWVIVPILAYLAMVGFLYCQFGLAYDIFTSGDMFAEFKKSFSYFKEHWWKYILLTFITGFSFFLPSNVMQTNSEASPWVMSDALVIVFEIIRYIIFFIILVVFGNTLPSVTAQGSLKNSFIESIRIVKTEWKRLIKTWGIYFLIFIAPSLVISLIMQLTYPVLSGTGWFTFLIVLSAILQIYKLFIGFPMLALMATRIYNSSKFDRFKPLTKQERVSKVNEDDKSSVSSA